MNVNRDRTLEELEGENWGDPAYPSYVVTTCHKMRRKPLRLLSDEEIRLAIGQAMGVAFLVPVAIERLQTNPLASGDMYEGSLIKNVLIAASKSDLNEAQFRDLDAAILVFQQAAVDMEPSWREECLPAILEAVEQYKAYRLRSPH